MLNIQNNNDINVKLLDIQLDINDIIVMNDYVIDDNPNDDNINDANDINANIDNNNNNNKIDDIMRICKKASIGASISLLIGILLFSKHYAFLILFIILGASLGLCFSL